MADQFKYVPLPDGSYGKFNADDSDEYIHQTISARFPKVFGPPLNLPPLAQEPRDIAPLRPHAPMTANTGTGEPGFYDRSVKMLEQMPLVAPGVMGAPRNPVNIADVSGIRGYSQIRQGANEFLNPTDTRERYEGAARVGSGLFQAATPLMISGGAEAPLALGLGLAGGTAGQYGATKAARSMGASPEAQELWGVVGGMAGGFISGGIEGYREFRGRQVESLANEFTKRGNDPIIAQQEAEKAFGHYEASGKAEFLNPDLSDADRASLLKQTGQVSDIATVKGRQAMGAASGAVKGALMQHPGDESKRIADAAGLTPERPAAENKPTEVAKPSPLPKPIKSEATPDVPFQEPRKISPMPGDPAYEAMRKRLEALENPQKEEQPDYLKRKLTLRPSGLTEVQRKAYTDNDTMGKRSMERYEDAMQAARKVERAGGPESKTEEHKTEALRHLTTWAQYAAPEDFKATLNNLEVPLRQAFEDFKLVQYELARQAENAAQQPGQGETWQAPPKIPGATVEEITRLMDVIKTYQRGGQKSLPQINKYSQLSDLRAANILKKISVDMQNKVIDQEALVRAVLKGKQATSQLMTEIEAARTDGKLGLGTGRRKTYESPAAQPLTKVDIPVKPGRPVFTEESIKGQKFNWASMATKAGNEAFGKGNFKVIQKGGKFYVEKLGGEAPPGPSVRGGPETPPKTPTQEPGQATPSAQGPGEPVRPAERPEVDREAERLKATAQPTRDTSILKQVQAEHPDWSLSQQLQEAAKRANPRSAGEGDIQNDRKIPPFDPSVFEGSEEVFDQFPGGLGDKPLSGEEMKARLEDIDRGMEAIDKEERLSDAAPSTMPAAHQEWAMYWQARTNEYNRLRKEFVEKNGRPPNGKEITALYERAANAIKEQLPRYNYDVETDAALEKHFVGESEIEGVKSPDVAELERMAALTSPESIKAPEIPQHDAIFDELVKGYMKKGMAQGTAERMARNKIEREKGAFPLAGIGVSVVNALQKAGALLAGRSPEEQLGRNVLRGLFGARNRSIDEMYHAFGELAREHDNDSINDLIRFNNAGERKPGAMFLTARDQAAADAFHDIYENQIWPALKQINPNKFQGPGLDDYLGRLFKNPRGNRASLDAMMQGRAPLEGGKNFARHRIYQWIDDSIAAGAKPITNNPIKMQMLVINQAMKYITAHQAFDDLKGRNLISWVKIGQRHPDGWTIVDDKIFQPRIPVKGGLLERGNYYTHPDVAKLLNNWLSPGLRRNALYNGLRSVADMQNMIQLGFSAFHFNMTTVAGAATSDFALGIQQITKGKVSAALKNMAQGLTIVGSARENYRLGNMMREEWLVPGTHPFLGRYVDLMEEVGGGIGSTNTLMEGQRIGRFKGAQGAEKWLVRGPGALVEASSKWLMQNYVPRLKMGVFAKMAMDRYGEMVNAGAPYEEIRTEMSRIWDSVDNRLGQLRHDNLFWNKSFRHLSQLAIRSVGWNYGTVGELFGGLMDIGKTIGSLGGKALGVGDVQALSTRAAYVMALPIVAGTLGSVMHYLMTGKSPDTIEDRFYPGPAGHKLNLATYFNTFYESLVHPLDTASHKIHPLWEQMYELLWKNADFYDTEIRTKGADWKTQAAEVASYLVRGQLPLYAQTGYNRWKATHDPWETAKTTGLAFSGFTPASKWIGQTKAERETFDWARREWGVGPHTKEQRDQRQVMFYLRDIRDRKGEDAYDDAVDAAYNSGRITDAQLDSLASEKGLTPFQREFKSISLRHQMNVLTKYATPDEVEQLKDLVKVSGKSLEQYPEDEQQHFLDQYDEVLNR